MTSALPDRIGAAAGRTPAPRAPALTGFPAADFAFTAWDAFTALGAFTTFAAFATLAAFGGLAALAGFAAFAAFTVPPVLPVPPVFFVVAISQNSLREASEVHRIEVPRKRAGAGLARTNSVTDEKSTCYQPPSTRASATMSAVTASMVRASVVTAWSARA